MWIKAQDGSLYRLDEMDCVYMSVKEKTETEDGGYVVFIQRRRVAFAVSRQLNERDAEIVLQKIAFYISMKQSVLCL